MQLMEKTKSNRWKFAFWIVVPLLTLCLVFAAYTIIDNGITNTYMKVGFEDTVKAYSALARVFPKNYSKKDIVFLLRKSQPDMLISEEKTKVRCDAGIFYFDQAGNLEKISLDEASDQ